MATINTAQNPYKWKARRICAIGLYTDKRNETKETTSILSAFFTHATSSKQKKGLAVIKFTQLGFTVRFFPFACKFHGEVKVLKKSLIYE